MLKLSLVNGYRPSALQPKHANRQPSHVNRVNTANDLSPTRARHWDTNGGDVDAPTSSREAPNLSDRIFESGGRSSNRHDLKKVGLRLT
jgi:hypothetical protein